MSTTLPSDTGLKYVIKDTITIPKIEKSMLIYFFRQAFSSLMISGIENRIKPINIEGKNRKKNFFKTCSSEK